MTYSELYEAYYSDVTQEQRDAIFHSWDTPTRMAWRIVKILTARKGFNNIWHEIDDECKDEIFYEIKSITTREGDVWRKFFQKPFDMSEDEWRKQYEGEFKPVPEKDQR